MELLLLAESAINRALQYRTQPPSQKKPIGPIHCSMILPPPLARVLATPSLQCYVYIDGNVYLSQQESESAALSMSAELSDWLTWLQHPHSHTTLQCTGDITQLYQLSQWLGCVSIHWEDLLADIMGDLWVGAHSLPLKKIMSQLVNNSR